MSESSATDVASEVRVAGPPTQNMSGVAAASLIGATIEWYDFILYGTAAALIFNKQFFPGLDPVAGTLAAFAAYVVGFAARPVGGLIFGHFGDKLGRKETLIVSMLIMGGSTAFIGLLPTYETIGIAAPILLVGLRLLQGIALGGETGGAVLISVEHSSAHRMNFYGSFPQMGVPAGTVLANLAFFTTTAVTSPETFTSWAWRIPFLLSFILVAFGLVIRLRIAETPHFLRAKKKREIVSAPGIEALRNNWFRIILTALAICSASTVSYVWSVFSLSYGTAALNLDRSMLLLGVTCGSILWFICIPIWGRWADRNGRRSIFIIGTLILIVAAAAYFPLLNTKNPTVVFLTLMGMGAVFPITHALQGSILADLFPAAVRYSGMGWTLGVASILGGMSPLLATSLFAIDPSSFLVSLYMVGVCAVSCVSALMLFASTPRLDGGQHF
ncbi:MULTISPECIES: MFS transporter [unclassified Beijerinckia]|uniref:MFS transporter n=1 Tax=unclassified Beijerinckia TaxID=2638183 RepID=UPI000894E68E|nr:MULTISPECIES: MFS transporter [unclassified Beijerinckia]MDH7797795.1 MFS family permease [Beijerinckia sp. GAS462]SEC98836.1 Major Facilitator Superfamily protein [Beijerinckia sp. 28-YEA-48]